jgi:hypothetical protein
LFLEISRLFFDGSSDLHFANFLHMVKTMAESGTPVEKVESFIVDNQNVPALPEQEAVWSLSCSFVDQDVGSEPVESSSASDFNIPKHQRSDGTVSSWPPNNWRTAPDLITSQRRQHQPLREPKVNLDECIDTKDNWFRVELEEDWVITGDTRVENTLNAESSVATLDEPQMMMSINSDSAPAYIDLLTSSASEIVDTEVINFKDKMPNASEGSTGALDASSLLGAGPVCEDASEGRVRLGEDASEGRVRLRTGAPDASQLLRTGRVGEAVVYRHFVDLLGPTNVRWVNGETESGLPYDLVITRGGNLIEYVEVKATTSSNKDWFYITTREWQFALEKGDAFTIARVLVSGKNTAYIELFRNPHKLCQNKTLHLALLIAPGQGRLQRQSPTPSYDKPFDPL